MNMIKRPETRSTHSIGASRAAGWALTALLIAAPGGERAHAGFATGFEAPTYGAGQLIGQDNWSGGAAPRVQTEAEIAAELTAAGLNAAAAVHGGDQAVIVTGTGGSSSTVRPVSGLAAASRATLDVWARPLTPGSSGSTIGTNMGNIFLTMEDSGGVRAAAIRFGATTDMGMVTATSIDVYSDGSWTPTGVTWQADAWYNWRLTADYAAKTYDVWIDGASILTDVPFYASASTELSQVRIFRGSGQAGMIVDDLSVIPEPAAMPIALVAGAALLCRCRRGGR